MFSKRHELLLLVATQLATYWCLVSGQTPTDAPTSMPTAASSEGNAVLGWILFVIICILCPGGICATCYYYVGKSRIQARVSLTDELFWDCYMLFESHGAHFLSK